MTLSSFIRLGLRACVAALFALSIATTASAQTYHEGFEADPDTWFGADRVASGTNGIVSSEGAFHAVAALAAAPDNLTFSRLGGYNVAFPSHGFDVSVDVWLDPAAAFVNDAQMDYTVAVNTPANAHRRDFVFNVGYYTAADVVGPGAGTNRYVMSASNGAGGGNADPKNPARNPIAIQTQGWYTFKHEFRKDANDVLTVRLAVLDSVGTELGTWTLSDPSDIIGVTVGGNRYSWFATNEWGSSLYFDESKKQNAPQPDFTGYFVDVSEWSSFTTANAAAGIFPVGGSGQVNGNFVVKQKDGVQIGLRASKRSAVPNTWPTYRDSEVGVYLADPGYDMVANRVDRAAWNYEIHADLRNAAGAYEGKTLDDFDLLLNTDIGDPLFGSPVPVKVEEDFPVGGPGAVLLQTSQNPLFGQATPFDYNLEKDYFLTLSLVPTTFVGATIEVKIRVDVTPDKGGLPTVDPIGVKSVEPGDGFNRVTLYTIVQDPDSDPLTVEWKVDGAVEQTETDVLTDSTTEFTFDFPLGASTVEVEVSDADNTVAASTTITVSDTVGPVVVVAEDVVVETDPGQDFAAGVVLTEPTVVDAFDGDPVLTNDAPLVFPLGETIVTWTATDASNNETTATQKVTVEDRESPRIGSTPRVVANVDSGEVFATIDLDEPNATDNVDDPVALTNDAPATFPVGKTQVNWTATDAAGNVSVRTQVVLVKNAKPVAEAGPVIRVKASAKSGVRVSLDGSASSDPDEQDLTFAWSAKGISFGSGASSATPSAKFPVGKTIVTLVVTDPVGVKSTDQVAVVVSFDKSAVIDGRPFGKIVKPYVDASVSTLTVYAQQNPSSSTLAYAASFAEYAKAYDAAAQSVRYNEGNLGSQTGVYLTYRYYQVYFSANAATYAYMGSGASDGYYYAAAAQYYGQADLDY